MQPTSRRRALFADYMASTREPFPGCSFIDGPMTVEEFAVEVADLQRRGLTEEKAAAAWGMPVEFVRSMREAAAP